MMNSLSKALKSSFDQLVLAGPLFDPSGNLRNMVVYPVFPTDFQSDPPQVITLTEALRRGLRLNDTGIVNQVHVHNPLAAPVLVGESDILLGSTQVRSVQFSGLIPPYRRASLPVSCVEAGQPAVSQVPFTDAVACPWFVRSLKLDQLARHGEPHQNRIWEGIKDYLQNAGTKSSTQNVRAVFEEHDADITHLSRNFPWYPGQTGVICSVGNNLFFELFSDPELLEDRYEQTLHSAVVEALSHPGENVTPKTQVDTLFDDLTEASVNNRVVQNRSIHDSGRALVFSNQTISGSALITGDKLVHLAAHKKCWGSSLPFVQQLDEFEQNRIEWQTEGKDLSNYLEQNYNRRRKEYQSFKNGLKPVTTQRLVGKQRPQEEAYTAEDKFSPQPKPLSSGLHEFFLNLFRSR